MSTDLDREAGTIGSEVISLEEVPMVRRERWEEIRRLGLEEEVPVAELARRFELDRKTVRRCLRDPAWRPYQRPLRAGTLLAPHAEYLRERASQVGYSAQILFQELRQRGYEGSYETVKLFVRPLRAARLSTEQTLVRFETPPGLQSQIDWGTARIAFRHQVAVRHIFVLTLGFSRRAVLPPSQATPSTRVGASGRRAETTGSTRNSTRSAHIRRSATTARGRDGITACGWTQPGGEQDTRTFPSWGSARQGQ